MATIKKNIFSSIAAIKFKQSIPLIQPNMLQVTCHLLMVPPTMWVTTIRHICTGR